MILFTSSQVGEVLQRLYNSEIDINISSEYAEGFTASVSIHQKPEQKTVAASSKGVINVIDGIAFAAARDFPQSDFAKWYNNIYAPDFEQNDDRDGVMRFDVSEYAEN
jgi:hypothetical protein